MPMAHANFARLDGITKSPSGFFEIRRIEQRSLAAIAGSETGSECRLSQEL